jgi:ribosomal protein S18 acetylase RimI-like enzyme
MEHVLDNPAWNALISGNRSLSFGDDQVKYFDKEVSPFAAFPRNTIENFLLLHDLMPQNRPVLFVAPTEIEIPPAWKVLRVIHGVQMVCEPANIMNGARDEFVPLTEAHVPQMLELTQLTNPGPFNSRTIEFGHYRGVFDGGKLVAMAGQRLHTFNYAEVSAVCTRPGYTGRGYARQLIADQVSRIAAGGEIPYLHSRADNARAISVYKSLGFEPRKEVWFYFMVKAGN